MYAGHLDLSQPLVWTVEGALTAAQFAALLASADRAQCPPAAPPQGLCLIAVLY